MKQTYLRIPDDLHKRLRHEAAEEQGGCAGGSAV